MLPNEARRTVAELVARYRLEPDLRDVYVEGRKDVEVVERLLARCVSKVVVYEIDTVHIEAGDLSALHLEDGRRSRVIYLAYSIVEAGVQPTPAITCLCDADLEAAIGTVWDLWPLLMTDGTSMDMYLWSETVVSRFVGIVCRNPGFAPAELIAALELPLIAISLIRSALHLTGLGLQRRRAVPFLTVNFDAKRITLDSDGFVAEALGEGDKAWLGSRLDISLDLLRSMWVGQPTELINGEDAVDALISFAADCAVVPPMRNRAALERILRGSLEISDLMAADTFQRLAARVC